jgi:autonomous glycyl radical cofactor GrcA
MTNNNSPYIDHAGNIIVPFNSDSKYHFWNGGQHLSVTLLELNATEDVWKKHIKKLYPILTQLICGGENFWAQRIEKMDRQNKLKGRQL